MAVFTRFRFMAPSLFYKGSDNCDTIICENIQQIYSSHNYLVMIRVSKVTFFSEIKYKKFAKKCRFWKILNNGNLSSYFTKKGD